MAFGNYGGYVYKNGVRVNERSDVTVTPEDTQTNEALWPEDISQDSDVSRDSYHALLGCGPLFVGLYQQAGVAIHRWNEKVSPFAFARQLPQEAIATYIAEGDRKIAYLNARHFLDTGEFCDLEIDGCKITIKWLMEDNYYVYARLEEPDGTVWHGFSGYGVGAGLDHEGNEFRTADREETLRKVFPDAICG